MFCPNCAVKNEDDVKFCRGCGQDISLVLRSVKEHSAIVLASKIDQVFDRPNEGMLIQGILFLLSGVVGIWLSVRAFELSENLSLTLLLIPSVFYPFLGILKIVQYRRSLSLSSNLSATLSENTLYCPVCGQLDEKEDKFCSKCGEDLEGIRQIMTPVATGRLARGFGLDKKGLKGSLEIQGKLAVVFFVVGIAQACSGLLLGLLNFLLSLQNNNQSPKPLFSYSVVIFFLLFGCAFTVLGWRDIVTEKRRLSALKEETTSDLETAKLETPTQRQLTPINAQDEISQINEAETQRELDELKIAESETKQLEIK